MSVWLQGLQVRTVMIGALALTLCLPIILWFVTVGPPLAVKSADGTFSAALVLVLIGFVILLAWRALAATYAVDAGELWGTIIAVALVSFSVSYGLALVADQRSRAGWIMALIGALGGVAYVAIDRWGRARLQEAAANDAARRRRAEEAAARARRAAEEEAARWQRAREDTHTASRHEYRPWWDILGVSPHASIDEINQRYRQLVMQYHPDRVAGLGPELIEVAERQTRLINAALADARQARGHVAGGVD
ncbi:MAG: J domain-containing protein [Xanthobacteraceae bacterium]|nr:J domain-containing protein [Xanthobacteraceae bacterium]